MKAKPEHMETFPSSYQENEFNPKYLDFLNRQGTLAFQASRPENLTYYDYCFLLVHVYRLGFEAGEQYGTPRLDIETECDLLDAIRGVFNK